MKPVRLKRLPENIRNEIKNARLKRGWSQLELGKRIGLSQRHVSVIETGKTAPRYDTLIEILRVLDLDLVLVPRELLPAVQALVRDYRNRLVIGTASERPLYASDNDQDNDEEKARWAESDDE